MSGTKKTFDKVKDRQRSKFKLAANPFDSGNREKYGDRLMETSDPEQNALTTMLTPDIPVPEQQPIVPIPDESMQENEARRRRARQSRTGRRSTILSGDKLGG